MYNPTAFDDEMIFGYNAEELVEWIMSFCGDYEPSREPWYRLISNLGLDKAKEAFSRVVHEVRAGDRIRNRGAYLRYLMLKKLDAKRRREAEARAKERLECAKMAQ